MSNAVTNACRPLQMSPTAKNVLRELADRADDEGVAWPSIPGICEATCYSRTAVIEAVKWLTSSGLVSVKRVIGRNNRFRIELERIPGFQATGTADGPVRDTDRSSTRTRPANGPVPEADDTRPAGALHPSASGTTPVRQPDPNHQETSENPQTTTTGGIWMPLKDGSQYRLHVGDIQQWISAYPQKQVMTELRQMQVWCDANPAKRKTQNGLKKFIVSWLAKEPRAQRLSANGSFVGSDYTKGVGNGGNIVL